MGSEARPSEAQSGPVEGGSTQASSWGQTGNDWYGSWSGPWQSSGWNGYWGSHSGYWRPYQWQWGSEDSRSDRHKTGASESESGGTKPEPPEGDETARRASTSTAGDEQAETASDSWAAYERRASLEEESGSAAGRQPKVGKDNIPEFDGSTTMREYQRRVRLFEISTSIDPSYRAQKLMEKLSGTAWLATESIPLESLKHPQGVERLLKHLWTELEPLEFLRVFSTLADFYKGFRRAKGQEFVAYDMAFRMHLQRLDEINAGLEGVTKAYWFLEKAGLSAELRKQVVAAAGGAYDYPKLRAAVMAIVPQVSREEENSSSQNPPRMWKRGTPKQVHATLEGEEDGEAEELPAEDADTAQLEAELEVLMTHAAKKRAAIEQSRGFRAPESAEAREKRIKEMKARMPCSACKAHGQTVYGHWHGDPVCPYRGKTAGRPEPARGSGAKDELSDSEYEPDEEGIFMATVVEDEEGVNWCANAMVEKAGTMDEMKCMALSDTCCARSVAGEDWARLHMRHLHEQGADAFIVPEKRPFRFGAGPRVHSSYSMVIPLVVDKAEIVPWIRVSVVPQRVPLLLSKSALKSLGAVLDLAGGKLELAALGTRTKLVETNTGLCGFEINKSVPQGSNTFPSAGILVQDHEVEVGSQHDPTGTVHPCHLGEVDPVVATPTSSQTRDSNRQDQSGVAQSCHRGEVDPVVAMPTSSQTRDSNLQDQSGVAMCERGEHSDPERLASELMIQNDFSFKALQRLVETIPLPNSKKHRDSQGGKGNKIRGMIGGVWAHGSQYGIAKTAARWPKSIEYINRGKQWSSFMLAKNVKTKMHKDNNNAAGSAIWTVTFGDFQGGELWVATDGSRFMEDKSKIHWRRDGNGLRRPGVLVDTREKPFDLDPKTEHATQPWKGERWCLSFYVSRGVEHMDADERNHLKKLGFSCPCVSAARTFGVNVTAHDLLHHREPHREREGHEKEIEHTPQQSHSSDSVRCVPPISERQDGFPSCSEAEERVRQCYRGTNQGHRGGPDGSRLEPVEGDMGGREAEEEGVTSSTELEEARLGGPQGDLQWDCGPRHGVPGRQALEPVGQGKADFGDLDVGRSSQGVDRPATGLQRLVRGVATMRKLWNSTHDPVQSSHSRGVLRMPEVSSLPSHSSSELQWPADRQGSEGLDREEGSRASAGREDEGQGRQQSLPSSRPHSESGRETHGRPSHLLGRVVDEGERDGGPRHLLRRRGQVQREPDCGGDERDHDAPQGQGRWQKGGQERDPARGQEVRGILPRQPQASKDSPEDPDSDTAAGAKVPLSADEISDRIAEGKRRRNRLKKGMARRLLGNAKSLAVSVLVATVAAIGATAQCVPHFAQVRPDVLEVFAGRAQITQSFARWGWHAARPVDIKWGDDLYQADQRAGLLEWIDEHRPRLVIVSYPCKHWSILTNMQYTTPQEKRRLQKLRQKDGALLDFVEQVFARQLDRGDDALAENPVSSRSFTTHPMKRVLCHPKVYSAVSHGCRHGVINPVTKLPLLKPTLWVSTSPEICDELAKRCTNERGGSQHVHGVCMGGVHVTEHAGVYTKSIARSICKGYVRTIRRKDPGRIRSMLRNVINRIRRAENGEVIKDLRWTEKTARRALERWHAIFVTDHQEEGGQSSDAPMNDPLEDPRGGPNSSENPEGVQSGAGVREHQMRAGLSSDGISFEVPKGRKLSEGIKQGLRKAHCNLGHPSRADLERFLKLGGAKQEVIEAVSWMRCVSCAHSMRPATHRAASIPPCSVTFGDEVQLDCVCIHDSEGESHWFLSIVDRATSFHMLELLRDHSPNELQRAFDRGWSKWAGIPLRVSVDMEGGFAGADFWERVSQAGTSLSSIAGTAHWQAGKVERHNSIIKDMLRKTVQGTQPKGREAMRILSREVTFAKNSLVREHGWSPVALVFGKEPRVFGELSNEGNPATYHPEIGNPDSDVAIRMRYRYHAKMEFVRSQARHMLMKTAHQRTRKITNPMIGQMVFFWRGESTRRRENQSRWVGPAFVVGLQGSNAWVACGGRCFLVAGEHLREAVGDETHFGDPEIQKAIALFKKLPKEATYENLVGQEGPTNEEIDIEGQPLAQDLTEEMEVDAGDVRGIPEALRKCVGRVGWHVDEYANPILVTHKAWAMRTPESRHEGYRYPYRSTWAKVEGEWRCLEKEVKWMELDNPHEIIPNGPAAILVTVFQGRTRREMCLEDVPLGFKRRKEDEAQVHTVALEKGVAKTKLKRMLEKEIPYERIPEDERGLYKEAEDKEWGSWLEYDSCEILSLEESMRVEKEEKSRVLPSRYVFRNKHAGLVDEKGCPLPVKAKARLCLAGHLCPDSLSGQVQVDSPTIERVSTMLFLHLAISYGWTQEWFVGDISNAFLQGAPLVGKAPMYMRPPKQGLKGVGPGQLLKLLKPVYGRPDAPRAWYEELARILCDELGFEKSFVDPAMFMLRNASGKLMALMIVHVDDVMVCCDGSDHANQVIEKLHKRFPFGTWQRVCDQPSGINYCGKEIKVEEHNGERQIVLSQNGFIDGRLETMEVSAARRAQPDSCATPEELTNYRSVVGSLQWVATQSRPDVAFEVNQLQKRVADLRVHDLVRANKAVREVAGHRSQIVFQNLGPDAELIAYSDAGLYSSLGVELQEREAEDLLQTGKEKRLVYSQKGAVIGFVRRGATEVKSLHAHLNVVDWKSSTNKRVIESSFAAETHAALMAHGMARFCQVLLSEIRCGGRVVSAIEDDGWQQLTPLTLVTDCKSVYDTVHRDG